jgi:hypothetical protein
MFVLIKNVHLVGKQMVYADIQKMHGMDDFKRNIQNIRVCLCCCLSSTASKSYQLMSYIVTCDFSGQCSVL